LPKPEQRPFVEFGGIAGGERNEDDPFWRVVRIALR
jgi:hypothetical protein